jgi:hypothetical protein
MTKKLFITHLLDVFQEAESMCGTLHPLAAEAKRKQIQEIKRVTLSLVRTTEAQRFLGAELIRPPSHQAIVAYEEGGEWDEEEGCIRD